MKKNLEMELKSLAEKIISGEKAHVDELKELARGLYEKLSVLSYLEKSENHDISKSDFSTSTSGEEKIPSTQNEDEDRYAPDGTQYNPEAITEPNTEIIKDIVEEMPPEESNIEEKMFKSDDFENELRNIGVHYDDLPQFEPVKKNSSQKFNKDIEKETSAQESHQTTKKPITPDLFTSKTADSSVVRSETKRSLNDRLKKGVSFGLNDRLVFIKHLFGGNSSDYDRVLSQLNTFQSYEDAKHFIETVVKPDYNHWKGVENYEERFLNSLETKMN